ncbi:carboxylic ester hydrolase-like [Macrosteles quadrilineatus]|uniref:carboxylic ester hydrolase-like n=1 Tax=Macrosteles quadrilineatus TaxID=74068 RepID=UPI0023E13BA8|nr:carboxylic ester hydrolase-like [Macrosteles quadrilineatus]
MVVNILQGQLKGGTINTAKGRQVFSFYHIPYAKPPIGKLRFQEPQPAESWRGVRSATTPGPACLQHITQSFKTTGAEDCLYLNVFTPVLPNITAVPPWFSVIVFFHNGVFVTGDSNLFLPTYLLDQDVILVTVNYRLGVLGFLSTEDLVVPGNNGLKDQVSALLWVRDNIESFGGDSDRVTIAGNTAGAVSVHLHFLSSLSAGLFQAGIAQSGSALAPWAISVNLRQKTQLMAATLGCPTSDSALMVDCLRTFPPQQLVLFTQNYEVFINTPFTPFGPIVEKEGERRFLTDYPYKLIQQGLGLDRPILFSNCNNEGLYPLAEIIGKRDQLEFLERRWTDVAPYLLNFNDSVNGRTNKALVSRLIWKYYIGSATSDLSSKIIKMFGDRQFLVDGGRAAALQAKVNIFSPVYFYKFSYRGHNSYSQFYNPSHVGDYGAANGDDLMYIMQSRALFFNSSNLSEDVLMRNIMTGIWASFAITGTPSIGNISWLPVSYLDYEYNTLTHLDIVSPNRLTMVRSSNFGNSTFWNRLPLREPWSGRYS